MKTVKRVALAYTSKKRAEEIYCADVEGESFSEPDDEPPPDSFSEYDTEQTIEAVVNALALAYEVVPMEGDETAFERLRVEKPDLVFNIAEGFRGPNRESHIPIFCEALGLRYTCSDALTLGICLDKARTKEILSYHGIPTARFLMAESGAADGLETFPLPAIVKPLREGSSKGIRNDSMVRSRAELRERVEEIVRRYRQPVLVEEFLSGREFTLAFLGNPPELEFLPLAEIDYSVLPAGANPVYGYEAKWVWDVPSAPLEMLICPAEVPAALLERIHEMVCRAARILDVKDWCRVDLRLDAAGTPNILELNPLPGLLPDPGENSALPTAARAAGYEYDELILKLVEIAAARYGLKAASSRLGRRRAASTEAGSR